MDQNKRSRLFEIGYKIPKSCDTCKHSNFNADFGDCLKFVYQHQKHNRVHQLSIFRGGVCKFWEDGVNLGAWEEFRDK